MMLFLTVLAGMVFSAVVGWYGGNRLRWSGPSSPGKLAHPMAGWIFGTS